jgi:hypothetical protein
LDHEAINSYCALGGEARNKRYWSWIALFLLIAVAGCNQSHLSDKLDPEGITFAKTYFDLLRHGQYEQIEEVLDPSINGLGIREKLAGMAALVPTEDPVSVKTIGQNVSCRQKTCDDNVTLEYEFPSRWLLVNVLIRKEGADSSLISFHLQPISESLEKTNKFTFKGKGFSQYVIFSLAVFFPCLTLYALVLCIRTKMRGRKWPWILFILLGVGRIWVLWTTGQCDFNLLFIQLLSAGAFAQAYRPWVVSVSLPLGAIVFLLFRYSLIEPDAKVLVAGDASDAAEALAPQDRH